MRQARAVRPRAFAPKPSQSQNQVTSSLSSAAKSRKRKDLIDDGGFGRDEDDEEGEGLPDSNNRVVNIDDRVGGYDYLHQNDRGAGLSSVEVDEDETDNLRIGGNKATVTGSTDMGGAFIQPVAGVAGAYVPPGQDDLNRYELLTKKQRSINVTREFVSRHTNTSLSSSVVRGLVKMNTFKSEVGADPAEVGDDIKIEEDQDGDRPVAYSTTKDGNAHAKKKFRLALHSMQQTLALPYCFGTDRKYSIHTVYLKKSNRGIGLRIRIIDDRIVVRGFASWFNRNNNLRLNDVLLGVNSLDARDSNPRTMMKAFEYQEAPKSEKQLMGLSIVEDTVLLRVARPDIWEEPQASSAAGSGSSSSSSNSSSSSSDSVAVGGASREVNA